MNQQQNSIRGLRTALYMRPKMVRFSSTNPGELLRYLQTLDENTSVHPINDSSELQMDEENAGMLHDGFRFTSSAFRQVAQIIAPGLSKMLPDISGSLTSDEKRANLIDGKYAIRIWNQLVDLRFQLFERYRIIRNNQEKTIEGLVSHKHQYLENVWMYREAAESLLSQKPSVSMYAAVLVGRRFSVWFRDQNPMFSVRIEDQEWPFHSGYYFTNGEATGTSVRGTVAVFTPKGSCLGPYRKFGGRVTHVGRDFMQKLGGMFSAVIQCEIPIDKLRTGANELLTKSLGYSADWDKDKRKERSKKLSHSLGMLGVQKNLADEVVEAALASGRHQGLEAMNWEQAHELYGSRTLLDLMVPLLWEARRLDLQRREKVEQAAFEVLTGRFIL